MTSTSGARWRARDSEADVETSVFRRPPPFGLDRTMVLQIMRDLQPRPPARAALRELSIASIAPIERAPRAPNVFLTPAQATDPPPLWAQVWAPPAPATTVRRRPVRVVHQRSILPWLLAVMSFSIAFGILQDPALRRQTKSQLQTAATDAYRYSQGAVSRMASKL